MYRFSGGWGIWVPPCVSTRFGDTTVRKNLTVMSPGLVSTLAGDTLAVDGAGTTKPNRHVTVNGKKDVAIPVQ
jgi:hypothetical protein